MSTVAQSSDDNREDDLDENDEREGEVKREQTPDPEQEKAR